MGQISCIAPTLDHLADLIDLDRRSLGGLWSEEGYRRELDSPNSCIRVLSYHRQVGSADPSTAAIHSIDDHGQELAQEPALEFLGLGCYWAIVDEAHITLLGIDPRYQRRGLGQWLLIHLLEDACDRGMARATLEVRASNQGQSASTKASASKPSALANATIPMGKMPWYFGKIPSKPHYFRKICALDAWPPPPDWGIRDGRLWLKKM